MTVKYMYALGELTNGGQERQMFYLLEQFRRNNEPIALVVWNYRDTDKYAAALEKLQIPCLKLPVQMSSLQKVREVRKFVKQHNPLVLHAFSYYLNFFITAATLFTPTVPIGAIRSRLLFKKKNVPYHHFLLGYAFPRRMVSNNRSYHEGLSSVYKLLFPKKLEIISNKLNLDDFPLHRLPEGKPHLTSFSIGRISFEKRVEKIAEVLARLLKEGFNTTHYHAGDGPDIEKARVRVKELGIEDHFVFCGTQQNINAFISEHDFMIHAAASEGFPNCIMEALTSGRAVVSTDCGDTRYIVENDVTGYVVPVNDFDALYESWKTLLRQPGKVKVMGQNARRFAENTFPVENLYKETLQAYKKFLN